MERIWAPWRMELIRQKKTTDCFFCDYIQEKQDQKNNVLERAEHCFVLFNKYPYNNGHLMVAPYKHTGELWDLDPEVRAEMFEYTVRWQVILKKVMRAEGFNIGINLGEVAGAGVKEHVHIHIVPRWNGDCNFMPVIGDTKVIPQAMSELYQELKNYSEKHECNS